MEFFKIWRGRGGTIGVNRLSLGQMVGAEISVVLVFVIFMGIAVTFLPMVLLGLYVLSMISQDSNEGSSSFRLAINILTVIATIYFLLDFHNGWLSYRLLASTMYEETYNSIAIINLSIGILNIGLFFVGHEIYRLGKSKLLRVATILAFCYFGLKITDKISSGIVPNVISQFSDVDVDENRLELLEWDNVHTDEYYEDAEQDRIDKENAKEEEMKDFDKNYANEYLN